MSMAQAAPSPGAECKSAGRERTTSAGTFRCVRSGEQGLRWRLVAASPTTTTSTTSTTSTSTSTTVAATPTAPIVTVAEPVTCLPVQVSWRGASPDTGLYSLQWVRVAANGTYDFREYTMWNVRGSSAALPNWLAHGATYVLRVFAMRADWDGLTHSNQNVTPHSAIVTFTLPSCNPPEIATTTSIATTTTTTVALTCATGGTCAVGDTGPGGGIVFYVHSGGGTFTCGPTLAATCRYLEAAPTSGTDAWTGGRYFWSGVTNVQIGDAADDTNVGTGYKNTEAIVAQSSTANRAGTISRAYRGPNNLTDWYLPSRDELNELCKYARGQTTGATGTQCTSAGSPITGFYSSDYWSSSEAFGGFARAQSFSSGGQGNGDKGNNLYVFPIRAFG